MMPLSFCDGGPKRYDSLLLLKSNFLLVKLPLQFWAQLPMIKASRSTAFLINIWLFKPRRKICIPFSRWGTVAPRPDSAYPRQNLQEGWDNASSKGVLIERTESGHHPSHYMPKTNLVAHFHLTPKNICFFNPLCLMARSQPLSYGLPCAALRQPHRLEINEYQNFFFTIQGISNGGHMAVQAGLPSPILKMGEANSRCKKKKKKNAWKKKVW